jgi:hypothetical protein
MLKASNRPVTMAFHDFKRLMASANPKFMDYFKKYDGFHLIGIADPYSGGETYFTKWGTPLATGTKCPVMKHPSSGRTLRAINAYLMSLPDEDRVNPMRIERSDVRQGGVAYQVNIEFRCVRKDLLAAGATNGAAESLQDLFHGKCLNADGSLNTVDYEYPIRIFDASFKARVPILARVEAIANYYGPSMAATHVADFKELVHALNTYEGVVAHEVTRDLSGFRKEMCFKIKIPCPIRGWFVGVQNTLDGFEGWDKILFCVEGERHGDRCLDAVCEIDLTDILTDHTRPSKGKVYANPKCVKYSPEKGTIVYELANGATSTSAIAPTLNALYGSIGKVARLPPIELRASEAKIRVAESFPNIVHRGSNRSFKLEGYEFLTQPIDVIMGVNDIWPIANGEFHLQAASLLCLPAAGFGPSEFATMPRTNENTLRIAAAQRLCRDRVEYYKLVGMETGPFDTLAPMKAGLFCSA